MIGGPGADLDQQLGAARVRRGLAPGPYGLEPEKALRFSVCFGLTLAIGSLLGAVACGIFVYARAAFRRARQMKAISCRRRPQTIASIPVDVASAFEGDAKKRAYCTAALGRPQLPRPVRPIRYPQW